MTFRKVDPENSLIAKALKRNSAKSQVAYQDILEMLDNLIDAAEDTTLGQHARDPLLVLRQRVETLITALRVSLIAHSCYGQDEKFIKEASKEISNLLKLREAWRLENEEG